MKVLILTLLMSLSAYASEESAVPFVVSIWKAEMITTTIAGTTAEASKTDEASMASGPTTTTEAPIVASGATTTTEAPNVASGPTTTTEAPIVASGETTTTEAPIVASGPTTTTESPIVVSVPTTTTEAPIVASGETTTTEAPILASGPTTTTEAPMVASDPTTTTESPSAALRISPTDGRTLAEAANPSENTPGAGEEAAKPEGTLAERSAGVHRAVRHRRQAGDNMDHVKTPVCTGAVVSEDYVLTTEKCADKAASDMGVFISAGVAKLDDEEVSSHFHEVESVVKNAPFALMKVKTKFTQTPVALRKTDTAADSTCTFTYWNSQKKIQHPFSSLTTEACPADDLGARICTNTPSWKDEETPQPCDVGADGAVLVCDNELTGVWGGPFGCTQFFFSEVQQRRDWIEATLRGGAGAVAVSVTALLGALVAATANWMR